ncbi:hypothetical protein E1301_Tti007023 [Triplophysa tibetana]|uniref:Uncharacterized protein n=1 Tax=Triplophysa tibetana TaxID=1572043 RepID=A0A5A9N0J6_9TELE|nr:hypothetical protein E1301_Tti007023 [Triplophysa tibetana]
MLGQTGRCAPEFWEKNGNSRTGSSLYVKQKDRDAKTKLFNGISEKPAAMEKCLKALPVLTAVSEQTKAMPHLDADDTKHQEDMDSQGAEEAEGLWKITDVINNQMINPFTCEEQELINISTGHKATS